MPSNIENANISALKLGTVDVTKGYIGHQEVYPNTREIQSAAWTDTSSLAAGGGSRVLRVTGEEGAAYNLAITGGSFNSNPTGPYVISSSPVDHSVSVATNNYCGYSAKTILSTVTPTGATTLQGGGATFTSSFTQGAGPAITTAGSTMTIATSNTTEYTTTINGIEYWTPGTVITVIINCNAVSGAIRFGFKGVTQSARPSGYNSGYWGFPTNQIYSSSPDYFYNGSGTFQKTYSATLLGGSNVAVNNVRFSGIMSSSGCNYPASGQSSVTVHAANAFPDG